MSTITPELHLRIHELVRGGYAEPDIAKLLDTNTRTVRTYSKIEVPADQYTAVAEHALAGQLKALKGKYDRLVKEATTFRSSSDFIQACLNRPVVTPKWAVAPVSGKRHLAVPTLVYSDWHLDEVVNAKEVNGLNGYDRPIALQRNKNCFGNTIKMCREYLTGLNYEGIYFAMDGDIFSGDIHEELAETNAATMMESVLYWLGPVIAGIKLLADDFGHVHIPVEVGNHSRTSRKPRAKLRVQTNFDWLFAQFMALQFSLDDKYRDKVTFNICTAADLAYKIYDTNFILTHGDQFKGGSGIAGALSPLMIGYHRKLKRAMTTGRPFNYMISGHWHQLMYFKGIICNGAGKGYDEYSFVSNFDYEKPRQALFMCQPGHGVTFTDFVHCQSDHEPWMDQA